MAEILLVDDDIQLGSLVQMDLEERGHSVSLATNFVEAISLLKTLAKLDIVICDIFLSPEAPFAPGNSLKIMEAVDERSALQGDVIPLIAISGGFRGQLYKDEVVAASTDLGAITSLAKPFLPSELSKLIDETLLHVRLTANILN